MGMRVFLNCTKKHVITSTNNETNKDSITTIRIAITWCRGSKTISWAPRKCL